MAKFEERLSDGRKFLHGDALTSLDVMLAGINYPWLLATPEQRRMLGGGADGGHLAAAPPNAGLDSMSEDLKQGFPSVHRHGIMMYEQHRARRAL